MSLLTGWFGRKEAETYVHYYANDLDKPINDEGVRRIKAARRAYNGPIDGVVRRDYEHAKMSVLPGAAFKRDKLESIRRRAVSALDDPVLSPCAYLHGDQAEREDVPRSAITHDVRRFTKDVLAIVPDIVDLLTPDIQAAIRSAIGSNFSIDFISLTRNYHVGPEITKRYELLSERWHFDHQYPDGFTLFVCLSDVTVADGPFHVIAAPDSRRLLAMGFDASKRKNDSNGGLTQAAIEAMPSFARLTGPLGAMMLCHTSYCLHRAGVPKPGHTRDMGMFAFRPTPEMNLECPRVA